MGSLRGGWEACSDISNGRLEIKYGKIARSRAGLNRFSSAQVFISRNGLKEAHKSEGAKMHLPPDQTMAALQELQVLQV